MYLVNDKAEFLLYVIIFLLLAGIYMGSVHQNINFIRCNLIGVLKLQLTIIVLGLASFAQPSAVPNRSPYAE